MDIVIVYLLLGLFVGFMGGLLGVGGGGLLVPLLTQVFLNQGVPSGDVLRYALATALAVMMVSSASSIRAHHSQGTVLWNIAKCLAPGICIGAFVSAGFAAHVQSSVIAVFFGLIMAFVAVSMFLDWQPVRNPGPVSFKKLLFLGLSIGAISSLAAVGGGFLTVTYLRYKDFEMRKAVGTAAAMGAPIALGATLGYLVHGWSFRTTQMYTLGFINVPAFLAISIAGALSAPFGARCSSVWPEARLKKVFAVLSLLLSLQMLLSLFRN